MNGGFDDSKRCNFIELSQAETDQDLVFINLIARKHYIYESILQHLITSLKIIKKGNDEL